MSSASHPARLGDLALQLAKLFAARSTPPEFCGAALAAIGQALRATSGAVLLFDDGGQATIVAELPAEGGPAESARALSRSVLEEVRAQGRTVLLMNAQDSAFHRETSVIRLDLRSVLATPLRYDGAVRGAIALENSSMIDAFTEEDRELLEAVSALVSPFLQVGTRLDTAMADRDRLRVAADRRSREALVGDGPAMQALQSIVTRVAATDAPVLVTGESGSGKELVARALHARSRRAAAPFVPVNCAAVPEGLMESELFGHERGAFTGAVERRKGRFEQAHGGTLFLDEIGELRPDLQAKLLRVLQERVVERVGGTQPVPVDIRIVAATHRNLKQLVAEGRFREDLLYRLDVVPIAVPPLRDRPEDLPALVAHFLEEACSGMGRDVRLAPDVLPALSRHRFPGNVRELRNIVHRVVALAPADVVSAADLPEGLGDARRVALEKDPFRRFLRVPPRTNAELKAVRDEMHEVLESYVRRLERSFLEALLEETGGNVAEASRRAGMNRTLFHRKLKQDQGPGGSSVR